MIMCYSSLLVSETLKVRYTWLSRLSLFVRCGLTCCRVLSCVDAGVPSCFHERNVVWASHFGLDLWNDGGHGKLAREARWIYQKNNNTDAKTLLQEEKASNQRKMTLAKKHLRTQTAPQGMRVMRLPHNAGSTFPLTLWLARIAVFWACQIFIRHLLNWLDNTQTSDLALTLFFMLTWIFPYLG